MDDGLVMGRDSRTIERTMEQLKEKFEVTVCSADCFVGMQIRKCRLSGSIFIHQAAYIDRVVKRFNLEDAKPSTIPADPHVYLTKCTNDKEENDFPYREAVGSLMFLAIVSRPDIMYAVGNVSRYLIKHNVEHWNAVKKIIKYVSNTRDFGICYKRNKDTSGLVGFSDADFAGDVNTRRSTTGYVFKYNGSPITWCSQRQQTVSLSTTEAEYIAASAATKEAIWLRYLLKDIIEEVGEPTVLSVDNQSAIRLIRNPEFHKRTKHIDIRYHFVREKYVNGEIKLEYVPSEEQLADIFTKPLARDRFETIRYKIGVTKFIEL